MHWGQPRITQDADLSLFCGFGREEEFIDPLLDHYEARISDAREFALANRVLLLKTVNGIGLDVVLSGLPYEENAYLRSVWIEFGEGVRLRICSPDDLIIFKAFAGRNIDWMDIEGIVIKQGKELNWHYIRQQLIPLLEAKNDLESMAKLEKLRSDLEL